MQPVPHPDTWFIEWLGERNLLNREILAAYVKKLAEEQLNAPLLDPDPPTLGGLLERDGLLTKEQRETGEREAGLRRGQFMAWRSQALRDQERRTPNP